MSSSSSATVVDEAFDEGCIICLEAFTSQDPATVTICKHAYHLQCILEWSQRSKECPICSQLLVLKDPTSQELLATVETVRILRSGNSFSEPTVFASSPFSQHHEDVYVDQDLFSDDSDIDERIVRQLDLEANAQNIHRWEQRRSGVNSSEVLEFHSSLNASNVHQNNTAVGGSLVSNSSFPGRPLVVSLGTPSSDVPSLPNVSSDAAVPRNGVLMARLLRRQPPTGFAQDSGSSDSFSNSIKSKWASVSARYKESISKSTHGIKEKLIARNNSVNDFSKGIKREMSAGIAGVARMIEKLDLTPKRTGGSSSKVSAKGKQFSNPINDEVARERKLKASSVLLS